MSGIYMLMTVVKRSVGKRILDLYQKDNLDVNLCMLAKGTATSEMLGCFGMEANEKMVTLSIITEDTWKEVKRDLEQEIQIDVPGTGIAFLMSLSSIGGGRTLRFFVDGQTFEKEEESVMKDTTYELIVVVANHGYTEEVMDAAREMGARGGTVLHAKGTGFKKAEKFLGVSIVDEKEMIFIVTKSTEKNKIMKSIMEKAGLSSEAKSVVFSIPVSDVAGLRLEEIQ